MKRTIFILLCIHMPLVARADLYLKSFSYTAQDATVTYTAEACSTGAHPSTSVGVYYDLTAAPTTQTPDSTTSASTFGLCKKVSLVRNNAPVGLYQSYAKIDPSDSISENNENNNVSGPIAVCVGPDVVITAFAVDKSGASVTYKATVCNNGSMAAKKFRVGFWHNQSAAPSATDMGNIFKAVALLAAGKCKDLTVSGGLRPNGSFTSWCRADSGEFVKECRDNNNSKGPLSYSLSNPDLAITSFNATVGASSVSYAVRVCNKGTAAVGKFYVDIYYNRPKKAPTIGDPGDVAKPVLSLAPSACTTVNFTRNTVPKGSVTSYAQADADDFISEPNEANNLSDQMTLGGGSSSGGSCVDADKDGYGTGSGCSGVPDCDDTNAKISPAAKEVCGDKVDDDCDMTPDDGCPGVNCIDNDGDGFGVGADCVLADCDDNDKKVYPWVKETCGDNKDNNCNKLIDDGCAGVNCVDNDMDGYGVGYGCKGVPDCNDSDFNINPGAKEKCGDKIDDDCDLTPDDGCPGVACDDKDGDGFGTGADCVLADCDDADKAKYPWAPEICGDNIDDNCNKIPDDGCPGRQCVDQDMDGFGVGKGCPGPQDCNDTNFKVKPGAKEVCNDGVDDDCDNAPDDGCSSQVDADGDGYGVGGGVTGQPDCDDNDAEVAPGKKEICGDKKDNDCDGTIDDGCPGVKCTDGDGDGWGVGSDCKILDCDDKNAAVHPWAVETCKNGTDDDCDGTIDDGCPGVDCPDKDHDGFGKGAGCCNDPKTKATCKNDCDDNDGGRHPWAKEICADGIDNDCDNSTDEGCTICEDADADGYGIGPKCTNWDCDDTNADSYPEAVETCDGKDNDCNGKKDDGAGCDEEGCSCALPAASPGRALPLGWLLLGLALVAALLRRQRG